MEEGLTFIPTRKLVIAFDPGPSCTRDYVNDFLDDFESQLNEASLFVTREWQVVYGKGPRRIMEFVSPEDTAISLFLESDEGQTLLEKLEGVVGKCQISIVRYRNGFQLVRSS